MDKELKRLRVAFRAEKLHQVERIVIFYKVSKNCKLLLLTNRRLYYIIIYEFVTERMVMWLRPLLPVDKRNIEKIVALEESWLGRVKINICVLDPSRTSSETLGEEKPPWRVSLRKQDRQTGTRLFSISGREHAWKVKQMIDGLTASFFPPILKIVQYLSIFTIFQTRLSPVIPLLYIFLHLDRNSNDDKFQQV